MSSLETSVGPIDEATGTTPFDDTFDDDLLPDMPTPGVGIGSYELVHEPKPERTDNPEKAIPDLFKKMGMHKQILLTLIDYCREERYADDIDATLAPLMVYRRSVYTPISLRDMLYRNGALDYIPSEEEQNITEEDFYDEDGNLVVIQLPEGTWKATPEGLAYYDAQNPYRETMAVIDEHDTYRPVYQLILQLCQEKGRSAQELDELVNPHPLLQDPERYSGYFIGHLEKSGALEWQGKWMTTATGTSVREALSEEAEA